MQEKRDTLSEAMEKLNSLMAIYESKGGSGAEGRGKSGGGGGGWKIFG